MAKRNRGMTEQKRERLIQEGRGQGFGREYKPWLTIQDIPSVGCASRIFGWKTQRIHHCLSKIEKSYLYCLDWADDVIDIREQFPLNIEKTIQIAEKKGIRHPRDPKTKEVIVMTTDFLITVLRDNCQMIIARTIKPKKKLQEKRIQQKLFIERIYWEEQGIDWGVITDECLPQNLVKNIEWLHNVYWRESLEDIKDEYIGQVFTAFKKATVGVSRNESLAHFLQCMDQKIALDEGTSLKIFRHLLARKIIRTDMMRKIIISDTISRFETVVLSVEGARIDDSQKRTDSI
ncbi:TnsA endonuclease N-terminal domain-containing protein [Sporomusa sp. GT1]|uniref:TnsA endonuclease N-terminal domain-containing protein n=1 Tax=Sporomusa sp. GT1 TaxID=1534747 RepID=UPI001668821F|nr:TnsA endonuclease N-terminal domain-containing protein [Sporomusa sp. GT1]